MSYDVCTATSVGDISFVCKALSNPEYVRNINDSNNGGWTSIMYAAYYGHTNILELLLTNGADVNSRNKKQQTSLMLSAMCGNDHCCSVLLKYRARIDDRDEASWTSLVYAVSAGYPSVVKILLQHGSDVNVAIEKDKMTPFLIAATAGHEQVLSLLSENGANQYVKSSLGKTGRVLAIENGHTHLLKFFDAGNPVFSFAQDHLSVMATSSKVETPLSPQVTLPISPFQLEPPFPKDLKSLLYVLGLSEYCDIFDKKGIDMAQFLRLNGEYLKEIGINKLGPRCKMNSAICRINSYNHVNLRDTNQRVMNEKELPPATIIGTDSRLEQSTNVPNKNSLSREQLMYLLSPLLSLQLKSERLKSNVKNLKEKVFKNGKKESKIPASYIASEIYETEKLSFDIVENITSIIQILNVSAKTLDA